MRRDQAPATACFRGSGLPIPWNGLRSISRISRIMRSACALSFSIHQARSSKALGANSKLLKRFLEWNSFLAAHGLQKALSHLRASEKIGSLAFGLDFAPELDGHDHAHRLALFVRDVLDLAVRHRYQCTATIP